LTRLANAVALGDSGEAAARSARARPAGDSGDSGDTGDSVGGGSAEDGGENLVGGPAPHGQLVLIGDFLAPLEAIDAVVGEYAERGLKGHILQLLDPAEVDLPFKGRVRFEGLEGERSWLLSRVEPVRADYRARLRAQEEGLKDVTRNVGWSFSLECTDRPPQNALLTLYGALSEPRRR
jgi:hypothetical protein